jgi:hypothetical protein
MLAKGALILPAILLLTGAVSALAEDCVPPVFYTSLPRDRDYYYGVARETDTDKARDLAIRNLGKQVSGDVEGWDQDRIDALAGPCQDKFQVAANIGRLLPKSTLLAGWEQDDFARCRGYSYVLVRIERDRVGRFIKESRKFRGDLVDSLAARVDKVEQAVADLSKRIERLERGLAGMPAAEHPSQDQLAAQRGVTQARSAFNAGKPRAEVEKTLAAAEDAYAKLEERMRGYQTGRDAAEKARLDTLKAEDEPALKQVLARIDSGAGTYPDAARAAGIYSRTKDYESLRSFCRGLLARPGKAAIAGHEDFFAYMIMVGDLAIKDDAATLKDGEDFLKTYPASNMYEAVKSEMSGVMAMARLRGKAAPAAAASAPAPCPGAR